MAILIIKNSSAKCRAVKNENWPSRRIRILNKMLFKRTQCGGNNDCVVTQNNV
jgi:hypothetical protein